MPLSNAMRINLYKQLAEYRPKWTDAEVSAATTALARDTADPALLMVQAWSQARNARNDRAICITWPLPAEATVRALPTRNPVVECPTHFSSIKDDLGQYVCCRDDSIPEPARYRRAGTNGPPAAVTAMVAASLGCSQQQKSLMTEGCGEASADA